MRLIIDSERTPQCFILIGTEEIDVTHKQASIILSELAKPAKLEARMKKQNEPHVAPIEVETCARCGKKAVKGKRVCATHLAIILKAQRKAVRTRRANKAA